MKDTIKFLGHPIHSMLIAFPLGLLVASLIFDFIALGSGNGNYALVSYWMIVAGVIGALVAAIFGFLDWLRIPPGSRAKEVGAWHGIGNLIVVILFAFSWYNRAPIAELPSSGAVTLSIIAIIIIMITGWLGGELVFRLGVGVDKGAHIDASNSLSDTPISQAPSKPFSGTRLDKMVTDADEQTTTVAAESEKKIS